jgi:hypothetical protein
VSAKHKRPFFVFAAVAAVCCMVLVTGIRGSKADDGRIPVVADGSSVSDAGAPIAPIPDAPDSSSSNPDHSGPAGADPSGDGGFEITTPGLDESLTDPGGGDTESGSGSGVMAPPIDVDPGDVTVPPLTDNADGKGRGDRGGKKNKGKDKGKDKDEDEDEEGDDSAAEEEVDPDVYELPDDVDEDHEGEGDHPEGPDDPETTP